MAQSRIDTEKTIPQRLAQYGPVARDRMAPWFAAAKIPYPPTKLIFVGLKAEKQLEIYAAGPDGIFRQGKKLESSGALPDWIAVRYAKIQAALAPLNSPAQSP